MKKVKDNGQLPSQIANRKFTRSYAVPDAFFLGAKVMRRFSGKWFTGTVDELERDEGTKLWHVSYPDFDGEDLTRQELAVALAYHPLLNTEGDLDIPVVGTYVWFSQQSRPRLGQVTSIDPAVARPVVVQLYEPQRGSGPIYKARFRPARHEDTSKPVVSRITLHQIILSFPKLSSRGHLTPADRKKLQRSLAE